MAIFKQFTNWLHWLDIPGMCVLASFPLCWGAGVAALLMAPDSRPLLLSSEPAFFGIAPFLALLAFISFKQVRSPLLSSPWFSTIAILNVIALPFYAPYFTPA